MIVAEWKKIPEIKQMLAGCSRVLVVGCDGCVKVCLTGGERETDTMAAALRMAFRVDGNRLETKQITIKRQCDDEFIDPIISMADDCDAVLSMACGVGVQLMAERFDVPVLPAQNTTFLGVLNEKDVFVEECLGCGLCELGQFGAICPVTRCSKNLLNGPCGGSSEGKCEIDPDIDCAWQQIYDRLKKLGKLDQLAAFVPPKDWTTSRDGGPRKIVREDIKLEKR